MTWPTNFASLAGGNEPLSLFDAMFAQVAAMVAIPCTATGTNSITLNPIGNAPSAANLGAYGSLNLFSFIAAATSTGVVSAQFGALASLPAFKNDGTTAVTTGDIAIGRPYMFMFSQALNSGGGGFYLLQPAVQPSGGQPTYQVFTSGSGTYNTPANARQLRIRMIGAGGGGASSISNGGNGVASSFSAFTANGGSGAVGGSGGVGGIGGSGSAYLRLTGASGFGGSTPTGVAGGAGAATPFGGGGGPGNGGTCPGAGGGGQAGNSTNGFGGGGAGEYIEFIINNPGATFSYSVGSGGTSTGGTGASGIIVVEERYQD